VISNERFADIKGTNRCFQLFLSSSKDPIQFYPSEEGYIVYLYNEVENVGFIVLNFGTEE
jgi:hypothetical protein